MPDPLIYYVRHGQTDWNAQERYQGQRDIPLNDVGRAQAAHNGKTLKSLLQNPEHFQFVSSPLSRTRETMEIMREEMGLDPQDYTLDKRLIEISYGQLEGTTRTEFKAQNRELYLYRKANAWTFKPQDGESHEGIIARLTEWRTSLDQDAKYVVVAHGAVGRVVRHLLAGLSPEELCGVMFPQDKVFKFHNGVETLY